MRTPFHEIHRAQGAEFIQYQDWELPGRFTNPEEEYQSVRGSVGLIDVSYRTTIRVNGRERVDFLHRISSNDIKKLPPGTGCHSVFLTAKGKIVGAMKVLVADDTVLVETEPIARQTLFDKLDMYRLTQKVELEDITESVAKVLVQGPGSTEFLRAVVDRELALDQELQHQEYEVADWRKGGAGGNKEGAAETASPTLPLRAIRVHETGEVGYELMVPAARASQLWGLLSQAGAEFGSKPVGFRAFNTLRVEAGIPWYGVDMDDTNLPQEVRMDHALDWDKGCYIGYEPVARIKFRGHVNRKLAGLKFRPGTQPERGNKVVKNDRQIGHVTTSVYSPRLNVPIGLGQVRREFLEPGTEVTVETASGPAAAVVAELPFYRGAAG